MKSGGLFEGNKRKSYGDATKPVEPRGGSSMRYSTGRQDKGADALVNTRRGDFAPTVRMPNSPLNKGVTADRPAAGRADDGMGMQMAQHVLSNLGRGKSVYAGAKGAMNDLQNAQTGQGRAKPSGGIFSNRNSGAKGADASTAKATFRQGGY